MFSVGSFLGGKQATLHLTGLVDHHLPDQGVHHHLAGMFFACLTRVFITCKAKVFITCLTKAHSRVVRVGDQAAKILQLPDQDSSCSQIMSMTSPRIADVKSLWWHGHREQQRS